MVGKRKSSSSDHKGIMKSTTSKRTIERVTERAREGSKRRETVAGDASIEKEENVFAMARGHLVFFRGSENAGAESFYFASDSEPKTEYDVDDQVQLNGAARKNPEEQ